MLGAAGITILRDQLQNIMPLLVGTTGNYETIVFGADARHHVLQLAPDGLWPLLAGPSAPPPDLPHVQTPDAETLSLRAGTRPRLGMLLDVDRDAQGLWRTGRRRST